MIVVQKFGGTSLASIEHLKRVTSLVQKELNLGNKVIVVVSAMGGFTDVLYGHASNFSFTDGSAERDVILAAGEQIASGLLALSLISLGLKARSWLGWQVPISTDSKHNQASISNINKSSIENCLAQNIIPIIAGFQGIDETSNRITTIGRGGSDISAVEVAISLRADRCDIYTDVEGVYTADPNLVSHASKLSEISYDEMLEMAAMGAKVLHVEAVERAMQKDIKLQVLSSFNSEPGTLLVKKEDMMKGRLVTAVTCNNEEACITVYSTESPSHIFSPLAEAGINVNIIVQQVSSHDLTFTVEKDKIQKVKEILQKYKVIADEEVSIVSIVGIGMLVNSGIACKMFQALEENNIKILAITTSGIKISVVVHEEYRELAVRLLHTVYGLDDLG